MKNKTFLILAVLCLFGCKTQKNKSVQEQSTLEKVDQREVIHENKTERLQSVDFVNTITFDDNTSILLTPVNFERPIEIVDGNGAKKTIHNASVYFTKQKSVTDKKESHFLDKTKNQNLAMDNSLSMTKKTHNLLKEKEKETTFFNWYIIVLLMVGFMVYLKFRK